MDLSCLIVDGKIKASYLCGYLNTGVLAINSKIVEKQSGGRLWSNRKVHVPEKYKEGINFILPEGVVHLMAYTDFMSKMDEARLEALSKICPVEGLKELYEKFQGDISDGCKMSKLFKCEKAALSWHMEEEGECCCSRLLVDAAMVVAANLILFECSFTHASRFVKTVLESSIFECRWGALCATLQQRRKQSNCDYCPPPIMNGTKMDLMAFHLFVRCCSGPVSDLTTAQGGLRAAFVGLGDLREASKVLEEISRSEASPKEQASYGIDAETQADALVALRAQVASIAEEFVEVKTDVDILKTNIIPAPNRIYVCGYIDTHFDYSSTELPRLRVLCLFGGLVSRLLGEKGLRETIGSEETSGPWKKRNVYDDRVHLESFHECLATLSAHCATELEKLGEETCFHRSHRNLYDSALGEVDKDELFKDMTDTKLADAGDDRDERERVFIEREKGLWYIFKTELEVKERASGGTAATEDLAGEAFEKAVALYTQRRLDKKNKETEKKKQKAAKAVAKAVAKASAVAAKTAAAVAKAQRQPKKRARRCCEEAV
jgi:hypothetical protein